MTIIELQSLNGNSSEYQQKKLYLDQDGLELLRSVKKKMYMNNYTKNRKLKNYDISFSSSSDAEVNAFVNADDDVDVVDVVQTDTHEHPINGVLIEQTSNCEDVNAVATSSNNVDDEQKPDNPINGVLIEETIIPENDVANDEAWQIVLKKKRYWNRGK